MKKNIVLIGMMGCGKSTAARLLQQQLKWPLLSTDDLVEKKAGKFIKDIFTQDGEAAFRILEHDIVKEISIKQGVIIDCGGGIILNPENLALLKKNGTVFFLNARPDIIYERIKGDPKRPLIQTADPQSRIRELYQQRLPLYNQADIILDSNDESMDDVVRQILDRIK